MGSAAVTTAGTYWPPGVVAFSTTNAHTAAFVAIGYEICDSADLEDGYEKVAIYANSEGAPSHAARQLASGSWTSKMGGAEDIEHSSPERLSGDWYGDPVVFLRRPI